MATRIILVITSQKGIQVKCFLFLNVFYIHVIDALDVHLNGLILGTICYRKDFEFVFMSYSQMFEADGSLMLYWYALGDVGQEDGQLL